MRKRLNRALSFCLVLMMLLSIVSTGLMALAQTFTVKAGGTVKIEAEQFSAKSGAKVLTDGPAASGGAYVGDFFVGNYLTYDLNVAAAGEYIVTLAVGCPNDGGVAIKIGDTQAAAGIIPKTGGWQAYQLYSFSVTLAAGSQALNIENTAGIFNVDYLTVTAKGVTVSPSQPLTLEAENAYNQSGGKTMSASQASNGKYVGDFFVGCYLDFAAYTETAGRYRVTVRYASTSAGSGALQMNGVNYDMSFASTKAWQTYQLMSVVLPLKQGANDLRLLNTGGTWNVDNLLIEYLPNQQGTKILKDTPVTIEAELWDTSSGIRNESSTASGGKNVGNTDAGDYFTYTLDVEEKGLYQLDMRVACGNTVGAPNGIRVGTDNYGYSIASVPITAGWQVYETQTVTVKLERGVQTLKFHVDYEGWNLDYFTLTYLQDLRNAAEFGTPYASSEQPGFSAGNLNDKLTGMNGNEWKAKGTVGEFAGIRFARSYTVDKAVVYGAVDANNQILSATLRFSDGSSMAVGALPADGSALEISFEEKNITWAELCIDSMSEGAHQAALTEFELHGEADPADSRTDDALNAFVRTASGWKKMIDTLAGVSSASNRLEINWNSERSVDSFVFYRLPESVGDTFRATLTLSSGETRQIAVPVETSVRRATVTFASAPYSDGFVFDVELPAGEKLSVGPVQAYTRQGGSMPLSYANVSVVNRWKSDEIFYEKDGKLVYASTADPGFEKARSLWNITPVQGGQSYTIQNAETGHYVTLTGNGNQVSCIPDGGLAAGGQWTFSAVSNFLRISNVAYPSRTLHVEGQDGSIYADDVPTSYHSANWSFVTGRENRSYEILSNKVLDSGKRAIANDGHSIISNASGVDRSWTQSKDLSGLPVFSAPNMPMAEAIYNLSIEEVLFNMYQGVYGEVFKTGTNWNKVWTRDTAMSVQYSLAWVFPEQSANCAKEKIVGDSGSKVYEQDTGTGGSYPVSTDRIITTLSVWEQYLTTGDTALLDTFYTYTENTIAQDLHVAFDKKSGLFKGETGGLDHRDKTYPDWMSEAFTESLANIAESKSSIVNIIYCQVYEIMHQAAQILGKDAAEAEKWASLRTDLIKAVNEHFWLEDKGLFASWEYPDYMGSPVADKVDVISNGYAVMYDIATEEQKQSIMENYPLVLYGANTVFPQKTGRQFSQIYHNRGIWPGWEGTLMIGAQQNGNMQLADEIWKSCLRGAAMSLTNKEVINYETGEGIASDRQLWSIAATLSGYYRVLYGMEYTQEGITFKPFVPEWMEGPFELSNYQYRNSSLTLRISGNGEKLVSIKLDGQEMGTDYVLPSDLEGEHTLELVVTDDGHRSNINLKDENHAICPKLPVMTLQNGTLTWTEDSRYTYKLWNGKQFLSVSGGQYAPPTDHYGVYSLVAVASDGITSEMSKPIVINAAENLMVIEAEDAVYNSSNFGNSISGYSGSGYVVDNVGNHTPITFTVNIPAGKSGNYLLSAIYNNKGDTNSGNYCGVRSILLDGEDFGTMVFPIMNFNYQESTHLSLYLTEGEHTITMLYDDANWYDRNMNVGRNNLDIDSFQLEYIDSEPATTVEVPEEIYKNELFTLTVTTPANPASLVLINENGRRVVTSVDSATMDDKGIYTVVLKLSVGTAGIDRMLALHSDGQKIADVKITVLPYRTGIFSLEAPSAVNAKQTFSVTVVMSKDLIKGKFFNEYGNVIGSTRVSRISQGDTWICQYDLVIGTAGAGREITFRADFDGHSEFPYSESFVLDVLKS